tara:strand:+ start:2693 stop:3619 length:927 start_codon:yes stop_codon:yes gene_type:complete
MLIKKIYISILISLFLCSLANTQEILIISKVNNEIITNIDIENEKKYLLLLNKNLNKLSNNEFFDLAKNSIIKEKIKKKEVDRVFVKQNDKVENQIIKNFYNRLGYEKEEKFIEFLDKKNISYEDLKKKLIIETLWNQFIYKKFNKKIKIDESLIEKEIVSFYKSKDKKYEYQLSEIVIEVEKDFDLKKKEILKYIEQFGFEIAANKYSKSDTSKYGGDIGWIKSSRLSNNIKNKISTMKVGEVSDPIQISNRYLFLKINNKREIKEKFDLEKELKQQINFEKNRQLNQFSLNYYKKLKKNVNIYESK